MEKFSTVKSESERHSVVPESLRLRGLYSPWILQARILEWVVFPFSRGPTVLEEFLILLGENRHSGEASSLSYENID